MNETNEERLERLKKEVTHAWSASDDVWTFDADDMKFLSEQAEWVPKLELNFKSLQQEWVNTVKENKRLREAIEQLEGELKEWADLIEPTLDV